MSARVDVREDWITASVAAEMLAISYVTFPKVAEAGGVRRKCVPGMKPQYCRADVARIARECVEKANRSHAPKTEAVSS